MSIQFSGFDWDEGNNTKNVQKHGITCVEAEVVLQTSSLIYIDTHHSTDLEKRYVAFGEVENKKLFISFTIRNEKARVISARPMSRKERKWYEEQKKAPKTNDEQANF
ncbi:MAG: BrnT family toxin [Deltaproteobacteria bacterium]|nr:MAG: BrnT family toxin [Deltaproteobacteria bacterium]